MVKNLGGAVIRTLGVCYVDGFVNNQLYQFGILDDT